MHNGNMNNDNMDIRPYMGDMTSSEIGYMGYAGKLGGEMVKRMIDAQKQELINKYQEEENNIK